MQNICKMYRFQYRSKPSSCHMNNFGEIAAAAYSFCLHPLSVSCSLLQYPLISQIPLLPHKDLPHTTTCVPLSNLNCSARVAWIDLWEALGGHWSLPHCHFLVLPSSFTWALVFSLMASFFSLCFAFNSASHSFRANVYSLIVACASCTYR